MRLFPVPPNHPVPFIMPGLKYAAVLSHPSLRLDFSVLLYLSLLPAELVPRRSCSTHRVIANRA